MQWTTTPSKPSLADDFLDDWRDREASFQQADAGLHKNPLRGRKRLPQLHQDFRFRRDGEGNQLDFGLGLEPRHQRSTFDNSPASSIPPSIQWRFDTTTLPHLPPPSRSPPPFSQYSPDVFENLDFDSFLNIANDSDPHGPDAQSTESRAKKREFECPHEGCDKSYSRAEHLYRHQLNHNPKSIYHCDFPSCGRSFIRQDLCARHKDRHTVRGSQLLQKDTSNPKSTVEMQPSPFRGVPSSSKYLVDESSRQAGSEIFSQTLTGSQKKKRSQQGLQRRSDLSSMYISYTISQDKSLDTEAQERTRLIAVHGRKSPVVSKRCKFYHEALEPCDKPTAAPSEFSPLTSPSVISSPYSTVADIDDGGVGTDQGDAVVVQQRHAQQQHMSEYLGCVARICTDLASELRPLRATQEFLSVPRAKEAAAAAAAADACPTKRQGWNELPAPDERATDGRAPRKHATATRYIPSTPP